MLPQDIGLCQCIFMFRTKKPQRVEQIRNIHRHHSRRSRSRQSMHAAQNSNQITEYFLVYVLNCLMLSTKWDAPNASTMFAQLATLEATAGRQFVLVYKRCETTTFSRIVTIQLAQTLFCYCSLVENVQCSLMPSQSMCQSHPVHVLFKSLQVDLVMLSTEEEHCNCTSSV